MVNCKYKGSYCIVRAKAAGVFCGIIEDIADGIVTLRDVRNIESWCGAASLSQLAVEGTKLPSQCKFSRAVEAIQVQDATEIIPCSEGAEQSLREVPVWML